ncbi:transglycosylase domain-containing protein [Skermania piniformis]
MVGRKSPGATRRPRRSALLLALSLALAAVLLLPVLGFALAYLAVSIPQPAEVRVGRQATIFAADGATPLVTVYPAEGSRVEVPLAAVPQVVRDAVLAAEDRDFATNPGFSVSGLMRAARDNLLDRDDAGGGSTITQQYVKNAFLSSERTLVRKSTELVIATKMARTWSKDDILAAYLNTIYYGRGAYGIAAAARAYFGKPVDQLDLAEGAVLAALIRTPSALDPDRHLDQLQARWAYVLDGMVTMGVLAEGARAAVGFPPIVPAAPLVDDVAAHRPEGLIRTQVLRELAAAGIDQTDIDTRGLSIVTTIDAKTQQAALDAVHGRLADQPPQLRAAVVALDPRTGGVRAYYGGEDGLGFDLAGAELQAGSSFKVFALIAGLAQGYSLSARYDSSPLTVNGITVTNVGGESCGFCSLAEAMKRSLNTSYYRLMLSLWGGPQAVADAAHLAGIPRSLPGIEHTLSEDGRPPNNGIVLGQYLVRPIDLASAYATLAASGIFRQPFFVQKVTTNSGKVLLDRAPESGERRLSASVADTVTKALIPIAAYSGGHGLADGRPSAAKTGTTELPGTGRNKDAWMIGYTPSLVTAVWVGTEQPQAIRTSSGADIYGSGLPADIWQQTMNAALAGSPHEPFPPGRTDPPDSLFSDPGPGSARPPAAGSRDLVITPPPGTPPPVIDWPAPR